VIAKFGVQPQLPFPDFLAVVGDSAGWISGACRAGAKRPQRRTLSRYIHLEDIPKELAGVDSPRSAARGRLSRSVARTLERCVIISDARGPLRLDVPSFDTVDDLRWTGPRAEF